MYTKDATRFGFAIAITAWSGEGLEIYIAVLVYPKYVMTLYSPSTRCIAEWKHVRVAGFKSGAYG